MDEVFQRFLLTFYTIVYGIIVSQFFSGWENLIRFRDKIRLYNIHLLWTILAFLFVIQNWWGLWRYKDYFSQNFICFFLILLNPIVLYLSTLFLFYKYNNEKEFDYKKFFFENQKIIFILFPLLIIKLGFDSFLLRNVEIISLENLLRIIASFLLFCVSFIPQKYDYFHWLFIFIVVVLFLLFTRLFTWNISLLV
ncbi:hypothetical protein G7B40_040955 [Aetokthonos hydrillicola Thurmond2011]|uniref:Uncharacterized protein n=1 Tax=Aetokthonos hydrillicola Thurmond2011 TaxID=2712845 RepID=A0AAP5MEF1_9CYAN|nr:hypothetical protein [Aetokthonos hydrillicola CCALA 1050]MDR9900859.1 hypothetical protein [Aetokthonos hydrillicola Thurmond2011]